MIHRALFGSVERFFAVLLEHYAGAFPAWLAPVQVRVLRCRDDHDAYADRLVDRLQGRGLPGRRRRRRRAARRPHPQGQAREAPLRARRRRRRRRARHGRREPARRRGRARRPRRRLRRPPARPTSPPTSDRGRRVSLDRLWAGWRTAYIEAVSDGRRRAVRPDADGPARCSSASWQRLPDEETYVLCAGASAASALLNAYPYSSGHLLVLPNRAVGRARATSTADEHAELWAARAPTRVAAVEGGLPARRRERRRQPRRGRRRRRARPPPRARAAPLGGRHQLHDRGRRDPGAARAARPRPGASSAPPGPPERRRGPR